jgi:hypothetical protein
MAGFKILLGRRHILAQLLAVNQGTQCPESMETVIYTVVLLVYVLPTARSIYIQHISCADAMKSIVMDLQQALHFVNPLLGDPLFDSKDSMHTGKQNN